MARRSIEGRQSNEQVFLRQEEWELILSHHFDRHDEELHAFIDELRRNNNTPTHAPTLKDPHTLAAANAALKGSGFRLYKTNDTFTDRTKGVSLHRIVRVNEIVLTRRKRTSG